MLPDGFSVRPPALTDLEAVADLLNTCTRHETGRSLFSADYLGRYWKQDDFNLAADAQLVLAADGQLAGFAQVTRDGPPPLPFEVDTWVRPQFNASGIGEYLLTWVDRRVEQDMATIPADVPIMLDHVFVYPQNPAAMQRLEKFGYQMVRQFNRMQIDMSAPPPAPQLPDGIRIRTLRLGQEEREVYEASEEAQAAEWGHERLPFDKWKYYFIDAESNFDPTLWFLAVEGETIVGHAFCRWERPGEPEVGVVRYLGVRPAWRRRGIALALLHHLFGEYYRRGKTKVGLGVDATSYTGADRLYERAGMVVFQASLNYRKIWRA